MKNKVCLVCLCLSFGLLSLSASRGSARKPPDALLWVLSLDENGQLQRQGMGIMLRKKGGVLTSASILAHGRTAIARSVDGAFQGIARITCLDGFQDTARLKLEPEGSSLAPVEVASRLQPPEAVWVGVREGAAIRLREAQLTKVLPFSPRLVLLKVEPAIPEAEPGSPVLNRRGELVGMLHTFAGTQSKTSICQFFLARDRDHPGPAGADQKEGGRRSAESLVRSDSTQFQDFWEGIAASFRENWGEAQEKFTAALARPLDIPEAFYGRGVARYHLGNQEGAARDLEEAVRRLSGYALAYLWLGKARERQGQRQAAGQAYARAAELFPGLAESWFRLGEMAYKEGDLPRAKACLERTREDAVHGARSWWYLGNIALKENRTGEAREAFNQASKLDPAFFQAYLEGGKLLLEELGEPEEAAVLLQKAIRLKPRQALPRYYLALAYITTANMKGAWQQYFALQDISPDMALSLAACLER